jgi:tripartite-type tricarboxylate transporter receptor subunit TctC
MGQMNKLASLASSILFCLLATSVSQSADFPTSPIKVVVPYAAGGNGDIVARTLGEKAGADLGQPIVIDNRSGGNGVVGAQFAARAKPDGYTLMQMASQHTIIPSLEKSLPYNLERDFAPVFGISQVPLAFAVHNTSSIHSIRDMVGLAKSTPGGLNYASGGAGSISHLAAARLLGELKLTGTHIPFRGFGPAVQALLGDQVQFICVTTADVMALAKSGDVRVLAVTADHRVSELPDVSTMAELGYPDFFAASWNAYIAPAKTPPEVIERLYKAYSNAANDPVIRERLAKASVELKPMSRDELGKFIHDETLRWRKVIDDNHIDIQLAN